MLKIDKLNFSYGDLKVLWDIDLEVRPGEIVSNSEVVQAYLGESNV